jgi:predicted amino acid-binding ACT domain protein
MRGLFVMIILAEIQDQTIKIAELRKKLKKKGEELGIQVVPRAFTLRGNSNNASQYHQFS